MPTPRPTKHPWTPQYAPEVEASLTAAICALTQAESVTLATDAGALTAVLARTLSDYTKTHRCTPLMVALAVKELLTVTNRQCQQLLDRHRPSP